MLFKSSITAFIALVLFLAYCQADPVPPPAQQPAEQDPKAAGQGLATPPPKTKLEECEQDCSGSRGLIAKCKEECFWTYAGVDAEQDPQAAGQAPATPPTKTKLEECEQDCRGSDKCKEECFWRYAGVN
ncbi:hypothetical protein LRAMOSA09025 [Lichtheimia ramosa]|uniref:Apple domain-containing protein n=1 Tax=Lichtheimia ramosa TaxID=688394 RepID=A0A077WIT5_9FUNG|nr:hypothetical protein LRAMOSA09025 [Lichtheimia ramosa]